jgi:hypothetical protein
VAEHADQPVDISSSIVPFGSATTDNASIRNSSISKLNTLAYFVYTTEDSYRF